MNRRSLTWLLITLSALPLTVAAQDEGFEIIYEGYAEDDSAAAASLDVTLYGTAGFAGSSFWASAGARAAFSVGAIEARVDAAAGTDGTTVQGGASTEVAGFGIAGDATWSPGAATVIDLRGWGSLADFQVTANLRLAGGDSAVHLGVSTEFDDIGLSANLGLTSAGISQASVGANLPIGSAIASASAGLAAGRFSAGAGLGIELGPVSVTASVGYDAAVGFNAMAGGTMNSDSFRASAIALYDNTGLGGEISGELDLGLATALLMARFSGGGLSLEVGGRLRLGNGFGAGSVAFDTQGGLSWIEVGFEMPL
ncbi:MAG: hypothetical protein AB1778_09175 [Candidatus Bipolaricaulota bacterium]